jgi:hypothetical protein
VLASILLACQPNPSASATPAAGQQTPGATYQLATPGSIPSPSGTGPITPTSDHAIVRLEIGGDVGPGPQLAVVLYDDGSMLELNAGPRLTVIPLTPAGLAMVLERLRASGLFTTSRNLPSTPLPMGFTYFAVTLADGPDPIRVGASNQGDDQASKALVALAEGIRDVGTWLPQEAFVHGRADRRPYLARSVRVTSERVPLGPDDWTNAAQSVHRVDWPLAVPPDQLGEPIGLEGRALRCGIIDGAVDVAIRSALTSFDQDSPDTAQRTTGWYIWLPDPALLRLTLHPLLPDEAPGCAVNELPGPPSLALAPRLSVFALLSLSEGGLTPAEPLLLFVQTLRQSDGATLGHVAYFADGTVLFDSPPKPGLGVAALRLSRSGLALIQETINASGVLRESYTEQVPDNATPDRMYSIVTDSIDANGTDRGKDPIANKIVRLARSLLDPVSWLPRTAWLSDPATMQQYRPASVHLQIYREGGYPDSIPPIEMLVWPLGGSVDTFGAPDDTLPGTGARSAEVSVGDAIAVLRALSAVGAPASGSVAHAEYVLGAGQPGEAIHFEFSIEAGDGFD